MKKLYICPQIKLVSIGIVKHLLEGSIMTNSKMGATALGSREDHFFDDDDDE